MHELKFQFEARVNGEQISGQIDAKTKQEAYWLLKKQGMQVWRLTEVEDIDSTTEVNEGKRWGGHSRRLTARHLSMVLQQLSSLLQAGIPLDRSLMLLMRTQKEKKVIEFLRVGYTQVRAGRSLSQAWSEDRFGFPQFGLCVLRAGESSGSLAYGLNQIAQVLDANEELKRLIITSLSYPLILLSVSIVVVIGLLFFAVPQFEMIFLMWGSELPTATRVLLRCSEALHRYGYLLGGGIIAVLVLVSIGRLTERGRYMLDHVMLRLPILGNAIRDAASARIFKTVSAMLQGGVNLTDALTMAAGAGGNVCLTKALQRAALAISYGSDLSLALRKEAIFPESVVELASLGSETGDMALAVEQCAKLLENETRRRVKNLTTLLEPTLILSMALVVCFIVVAILIPVVTMINIPF